MRTQEDLPLDLCTALQECDGLLVLTEYSEETTPFRMAVLDHFMAVTRLGRAVSMPGVRSEHFHFIDVDYASLERDCDALGAILLRSNRIRIETHDASGTRHELSVSIRECNPTPSPGVVPEHEWDNAPGGETFVLPRRHSAKGSVVVTGSFPGFPLCSEEEVILFLDRGKLVGIDGRAPSHVITDIKELFFAPDSTATPKTRNSTALCEIGFGANRAIRTCLGQPVFDEKGFGTVHVAFGRNRQLGGRIDSEHHHDVVISQGKVYVDALHEPLLEDRELALGTRNVWPSWRDARPGRNTVHWIRSAGKDCEEGSEGQLHMNWYTPSGTRQHTRIGDVETSEMASVVYSLVRQARDPVGCSQVIAALRKRGLCPEEVHGLLRVLLQYGIIERTNGR